MARRGVSGDLLSQSRNQEPEGILGNYRDEGLGFRG